MRMQPQQQSPLMRRRNNLTPDDQVIILIVLGAALVAMRIIDAVLTSIEPEPHDHPPSMGYISSSPGCQDERENIRR